MDASRVYIAIWTAFAILGTTLIGCKENPDLKVPLRLPYNCFLPTNPFATIWMPTPRDGGIYPTPYQYISSLTLSSQNINKVYSMDRTDSLGNKVVFYWTSELLLLDYCNCINPLTYQTDSLFCPPSVGDSITIYTFICNTGLENVKKKTVTMQAIRKIDGHVQVRDIVISETPAVNMLSCTPIITGLRYPGPDSYEIETVADYQDEVEEEIEENNGLLEFSESFAIDSTN